MITIITNPLEQLDFADNQGFQQFLMFLMQMQQLQELENQTSALDALHFGRRADNVPQFRPPAPAPFAGSFQV